MEHKNTFTEDEANRISELLHQKSRTLGKSEQKKIRDKLRSIGFYITDYSSDQSEFTIFDFENLIKIGRIKIFKDQ